jgi:presenilin-like A22 family membrane protease
MAIDLSKPDAVRETLAAAYGMFYPLLFRPKWMVINSASLNVC